MNQVNLKEVERRTYITYHQDGLIDIFIGIYVLLFAVAILVNNILDLSTWFVIPAIFPALMVPLWISIKKRVTVPRIGYVKFKAGGANRMTALFLGLMVAGIGMFFVFGFSSTQNWALTLRAVIVSNSMVFIGIGGFIVASLFGYTVGLRRLYAYGLLTLVLFTTLNFVAFPFEYVLLAIGLAIIVWGLILLMQFIRKYPITNGE